MMRTYRFVATWRRMYPGVRALLLQTAQGKRILLRQEDPEPRGKYCLVGVIE